MLNRALLARFAPVTSRPMTSRSTGEGGAKCYYGLLGLTPRASPAQIKKAYYRLSMVHHPDRNEGSKEAEARFKEITEAYNVLSNVRMRRLYDERMRYQGPARPSFAYRPRASRAPEGWGRSRPRSHYNADHWFDAYYRQRSTENLHRHGDPRWERTGQDEFDELLRKRARREHDMEANFHEKFLICMWFFMIMVYVFESILDPSLDNPPPLTKRKVVSEQRKSSTTSTTE